MSVCGVVSDFFLSSITSVKWFVLFGTVVVVVLYDLTQSVRRIQRRMFFFSSVGFLPGGENRIFSPKQILGSRFVAKQGPSRANDASSLDASP